MRLTLLGPPGSGKGTQSRKLSEHYDIPRVSTGDMFRAAKEQDTELGRKVKDLLDSGELVPDHITNKVVDEQLAGVDEFVLDGYPRNIGQAEHLQDEGIDYAILLEVSEGEVVRRISGRRVSKETGDVFNINLLSDAEVEQLREEHTLVQRDDAKPDVVRNRLQVHREKTEPVVTFYEERDQLIRIDGEQPIQKVFDDIVAALPA